MVSYSIGKKTFLNVVKHFDTLSQVLSLCCQMASIRLKPKSPFFFACFTGPTGVREQRSTKIPNAERNRRKAQGIADQWEKAAKLGATRRLSEAQARRVVADIYELVNDEPLASASTRDFLNRWVDGLEKRRADGGLSPRTAMAYAQVVRDFMASLGERASRDVSQITKGDVTTYRDAVLKRTSIPTANKSLKYLRVALGAAYKAGLSQDNPAAKLDTLKRRHDAGTRRRPFTLPELKLVLSHASTEWKGLILFGLYTGARLKDIARLTWANIDTEADELRYVSGKTNRPMHLPLAKPLVALLATMDGGDNPLAPLFPEAYKIAMKPKDDSRLSQQFYDILFAAGLLKEERSHEETGEGRNKSRTVNALSFHCLR